MAKIFKGDVNFGFVINQTGAQPLDSRSVVQSYAELLKAETFGTAIYNGMTVATIDEQKVYMLVDKTKATVADGWKEIGAGGAVSVETYAEAVALASDENIGQVIYVKTKSSFDADGEGEGAAIEYDAAPYIVIGEGSLQKLAASTASGDIEGDVAELTTKVSGLETTVGNAESGLVKDVADLQTAVDNLPDTFVTDVKDASGNSVVVDGVVTLGDYATKEEVSIGLAAKADASTTYTKEEVDAAIEGVIGQIPDAPFQSVIEGDKILTLGEGGVLKSDLTFDKKNIDGAEYLVVAGKDGVEIGKVATAEFTVDGILDDVKFSTEEGKENILVLTFNADSGKQDIEVDFGKYVDAYNAGNGLTLANKTFAVDFTKVEAAGAAAAVKSEIETKLADYAKSADVYSKTDADSTFVKSEGYVEYTQDEKTKLAGIAAGAEVNVVKEVDTTGVLGLDGSGKLSVDLSAYALSATVDGSLAKKVDKEEGKSLVNDTLITKLGNMVEIKSVGGDLTFTDGALSVDLSGKVDVVEGKGLSTNDFTDELKTKLEGIATGAEVNYVKSVGANLAVSDVGQLTVDLSALATSESLTNGLAAKLDASAKVNGVSFVAGEATLDAGDIALEAAITRTENGEEKNVYEASSSIQSVLAGLSARIDTLDPNISGEFGVSAITAGNGIEVSGASSTPTISVKASAVEGNMAEVKTDGVYIRDMRSQWEAI